MIIKYVHYGDIEETIVDDAETFEFRTNHVTNWLRIKHADDSTSMMHDVCAVKGYPEWIPTNKRMPKPNESVDSVAVHYLIQNEYGDMMVASYDGIGWQQMYQHGYVEDEVVAWMILPQKYKGGEK